MTKHLLLIWFIIVDWIRCIAKPREISLPDSQHPLWFCITRFPFLFLQEKAFCISRLEDCLFPLLLQIMFDYVMRCFKLQCLFESCILLCNCFSYHCLNWVGHSKPKTVSGVVCYICPQSINVVWAVLKEFVQTIGIYVKAVRICLVQVAIYLNQK